MLAFQLRVEEHIREEKQRRRRRRSNPRTHNTSSDQHTTEGFTMNRNYDVPTGDLLQACFPYMFNSKDNIGFSFLRGWMPILAGLCVEIDQLLGERREAFYWQQIKEKFGTGRFYYAIGNARNMRADLMTLAGRLSVNVEVESDEAFTAIKQSISSLVREAEEETARSCMICGAEAKPRTYGAYVLTLCAAHHPDRLRQPEDQDKEAVWRLADAAKAPGAAKT